MIRAVLQHVSPQVYNPKSSETTQKSEREKNLHEKRETRDTTESDKKIHKPQTASVIIHVKLYDNIVKLVSAATMQANNFIVACLI